MYITITSDGRTVKFNLTQGLTPYIYTKMAEDKEILTTGKNDAEDYSTFNQNEENSNATKEKGISYINFFPTHHNCTILYE